MKAFYQGQIDYFCGLYAIINATRIASGATHKFNYNKSCAFFQHLMQYLYDNNKFLEVLYHGTSLELMDDLLAETRRYLKETYDMNFHYKKVINSKKYSVSKLGDYINAYLKRPNTACVIRLYNEELGDHWTVAQNKASTILKLFDSYFHKQIDLAETTFKSYKRDGLNHIVREGVILIKILP